jgi:hypothetical protein
MKITNEMLEDAEICGECESCSMNKLTSYEKLNCISLLAEAFFAERAEKVVDVWKGAPDNAVLAKVFFYTQVGEYSNINNVPTIHTRELPKTKEQQIAEKYANQISIMPDTRKSLYKAFLEAFEELKNSTKQAKIELLEELKTIIDLDTGKFISPYQEGIRDRNDEIRSLLNKSIKGIRVEN